MTARRPRLAAATVACALVLSACSGDIETSSTATRTAGDQGAGAPSTLLGMHDGRVSQGAFPDAPIGAMRLWDSGTSWTSVETSPGAYTWGSVDTAVETSEARDARPLLVLGQTPAFHATKPDQEASYGPGAASMPDLNAWRDYVTAAAERYGDRVEYQIWNEANVIQYWTGTPQQMATLTTAASEVIREVAPEATIVAPAFALRLPTQQRYFEAYWSALSKAVDPGEALDAASANLYPLAEEPPEAQLALIDLARSVLEETGADLPLWNTEINYGLQGGPEPPQIPSDLQRAYVLRTYLLNAGADIPRAYWYRWDIPRIANTYMTEEDMTTETPAGESWDLLQEWLADTSVEECLEDGDGLWTCQAAQGETEVTFVWSPEGIGSYDVDGARWEEADGSTDECPDGCAITVGPAPIKVEAVSG